MARNNHNSADWLLSKNFYFIVSPSELWLQGDSTIISLDDGYYYLVGILKDGRLKRRANMRNRSYSNDYKLSSPDSKIREINEP